MALDWEGDRVKNKMFESAKTGINATISAASIHAKNHHPWRNRTGVLEGSIRPVRFAEKSGNEIVGLWGSVDVKYAIFLEIGTFKITARPYLRPAADVEYPKLAGRIKRAFNS